MLLVPVTELKAGDKIISKHNTVLTVKSISPSIIKGDIMINHDGDPDWSSVARNRHVQVLEASDKPPRAKLLKRK